MAITINWITKVINVPQADLTFISGTLYELDTDQFRKDLLSIQDSEEGIPFIDTHRHFTQVTIAGVTYARLIEIINGYTVQFEDGQYAVRLVGSNNNFFDEGIIVRNQVSIIPTNSAGLQVVQSAAKPTEAHVAIGYVASSSTIRIQVWGTRLGVTIASPTSCTVNWYNPDGTLLFTVSDSGPDSQGIFEITQIQALADNTAYTAEIQVVDVTGTITNTRGIQTGS